uniref:CCHC-type domain-containing protein n=1 Tax=Meloidogyne javanica TaxID=6303 RepID=A0A915LBX0_MELJA
MDTDKARQKLEEVKERYGLGGDIEKEKEKMGIYTPKYTPGKLKHEIRQNSAVKLAKIDKDYQQKENQLMLIEEKIDRLITNREDGKFAYPKKRLGWNSKTAEFSPLCYHCGKRGHVAKACLFAGGLRGTSTSYRRETVTTVQQTEKEGEEGKSEEKVVVLAEWTSKTGGTYTDDECETSDTGEEVVGVEK